jgi:hypothetical protein
MSEGVIHILSTFYPFIYFSMLALSSIFFSEYFNYLHVVKTVNINSSQNTEHERAKVHFYHQRLEGSCKGCSWICM